MIQALPVMEATMKFQLLRQPNAPVVRKCALRCVRPLHRSSVLVNASISRQITPSSNGIAALRQNFGQLVETATEWLVDCLPLAMPLSLGVGAVAYANVLPATPNTLANILICGAVPFTAYFLLPTLDSLIGPRARYNKTNLPPTSFAAAAMPVLFAASTIAATAVTLYAAATTPVKPLLLGLLTFGLGVCHSVSIAASHNAIHNKHPANQFFGELQLATTWFWPYARAHHSHHLNVGTPKDHATAPLNQTFYQFLVQYLVGNYQEAWRVEAEECRKEGHPVLSFHNRTLNWLLVQVGMTSAVYASLGPVAVAVFLGAAAASMYSMTAADYVLHYGLRRPVLPSGRYAPVSHYIAWNSPYLLENVLFYNGGVHSDHHVTASTFYRALRNQPEAPTFPMPYFWTGLTATVPPVFFHLMNKKAEAVNAAYAEAVAAAASATTAGPCDTVTA